MQPERSLSSTRRSDPQARSARCPSPHPTSKMVSGTALSTSRLNEDRNPLSSKRTSGFRVPYLSYVLPTKTPFSYLGAVIANPRIRIEQDRSESEHHCTLPCNAVFPKGSAT